MFLPEEHSFSHIAPGKNTSARADRTAAKAAPVPSLNALERRVVEIARNDALDTLKPHRHHGWFVRLFLGREHASPVLANEKLEAIRRLAVLAWHNRSVPPPRAIGEARSAGLDRKQIDEILAITRRSPGASIEKTAP